MDERVMQFRVGVMVLATLIIVAILLVMFGKLPNMIPGRTYSVQISFRDADGVTKDTPVRKSGILIGRVSDVELTDQDAGVLVTVALDKKRTIYRNEIPRIRRDLMGNRDLEFVVDRRKPGPGEPVKPGAVLNGEVTSDPTGMLGTLAEPINTVNETGKALAGASEELKKAAEKVNRLLDSEERTLHNALGDAAESLKAMRSILGDEETQQRLAQAMRKMPDTLESMNNTFQSANKSLHAFTTPGRDGKTAIDRMLRTIEMTERTVTKFTQASDTGKPAPADQIAAAMDNINEITALMRQVMGRIDRGDGSLGALLNDRQLYDRLNRAARNIEQVTREIQPIVADARVITDKIARHPGVIVRDAVKPGVGIK